MTFNKSAGFMFTINSEDDGSTVTETVEVSGTGAMITSGSVNKISGTTAITAGTVDIDSAVAFDDLTVAEGATLALGDSAALYAASDIDMDALNNFEKYPYDLHEIAETSKGVIINGTMTVAQTAKVLWGPVVVNGTMTIAENNTTSVDLDILDVHGTLTVGEGSTVFADMLVVDGAVNGNVDIKVMFAYPTSDLTASGIDMKRHHPDARPDPGRLLRCGWSRRQLRRAVLRRGNVRPCIRGPRDWCRLHLPVPALHVRGVR